MPKAIGKCPMCGKQSAEAFSPFCSSRCSILDLGKWLGEGYRCEAVEDDEESVSSAHAGGDEDNE